MNIKDKKDNIEFVLKNKNIVTIEGELVKIHDEVIEEISKEIIKNEAEQSTKDKEKIDNYKSYMKDKNILETAISEKLGKFYFNFYNSISPQLERQYKFRFIYLCTFLKYDDNRLQYKLNGVYHLYKEKDLMSILNLKRTEYSNTKKELLKYNLISIDEDKNICINNMVSSVGKINNSNGRDYIRIFKDSIQYLYDNSLPRQHKQLGLFIDMLPFIHYKYNIVCKNPSCDLLEDIIPFTPNELAENLHMYTGKNISTFKRKLLSIKVKEKDAMLYTERFDKKFFAVNPLIYYKGNNIDDLNYLIGLFKI